MIPAGGFRMPKSAETAKEATDAEGKRALSREFLPERGGRISLRDYGGPGDDSQTARATVSVDG